MIPDLFFESNCEITNKKKYFLFLKPNVKKNNFVFLFHILVFTKNFILGQLFK